MKHENEKLAFRAPIHLFSVWVLNPITWKNRLGKKKYKRKAQAVIEQQDEMPSLGEKGRQEELKQLHCSLRKKLFQIKVNECVLNNRQIESL